MNANFFATAELQKRAAMTTQTDAVEALLQRLDLPPAVVETARQHRLDVPLLGDLAENGGLEPVLGVADALQQSRVRVAVRQALRWEMSHAPDTGWPPRPAGSASTSLLSLNSVTPPPSPPSAAGQLLPDFSTAPYLSQPTPLFVHVNFLFDGLGHVDTVNMTARVKFMMTMAWNDERAKGLDDLPSLDTAWAPEARLLNSVGDMICRYSGVNVKDAIEGTLARNQWFEGTISNFMNLRDFPMDLDDIVINLIVSNGAPVDMNGDKVGMGTSTDSSHMMLCPMRGPKGVNTFWG
eukprot:894576-Prymnesium_polylepis.1